MWMLRLSFAIGCSIGLGGCAERVLVQGRGELRAGDVCEGDDQCVPGTVCWNEICVGEGTLRVSLSWEAFSDFDIHVLPPGGEEISFERMVTPDAQLDVDDCVHGDCRVIDGVHVENVVFDGEVSSGEYQVWVVNYDGHREGEFRLEVAGAVNEAWEGWLPSEARARSDTAVFHVE